VTRRALAVVAAVVVFALAACGGGASTSDRSSSSGPSLSARPTTPAQIRIVSPEPNAVLQGPDVPVTVELTGANVVPLATTDVRPDEGHIHLSIDGRIVSMTGGTTDTIPNVAPGSHSLTAEFVAGDHAPFANKVVTTTLFTVQ
jgi:hypothetical protein